MLVAERNIVTKLKGEWKTLAELSKEAIKTPQYAGQVWLTNLGGNALQTFFYTYAQKV